jgi:hypothetical protein
MARGVILGPVLIVSMVEQGNIAKELTIISLSQIKQWV